MTSTPRPSPFATSFAVTAFALSFTAIVVAGAFDAAGLLAVVLVALLAAPLSLTVRLLRRAAAGLDRPAGWRGLVSLWLVATLGLALPVLAEQALDGALTLGETALRMVFVGGLGGTLAVATALIRRLTRPSLEARTGSAGLLGAGLLVAGFAASPYVADAARLRPAAAAFCLALAAAPTALVTAWEARLSDRAAWRRAGVAVAALVLLATAWFTLFAFHRLYPRVHLAANVFAALAAAAVAPIAPGLPSLRRREALWPLVYGCAALVSLGVSEPLRFLALERTPLGHALCYCGLLPGRLFTRAVAPDLVTMLPPAGDLADAAPSTPPLRGIVFVTVDALRADRLSDASVMPATFAWSRQGTRFVNARTAYTSTYACLRSIAKGQYPSGIGTAEEGVRLFDLFSQAGCWTATVNLPVRRARIGQVDQPLVADDRPVGRAEVTRYALELLEQVDERPFFFWVHYYDAHTPIRVPKDLADEARTGVEQYDAALRGIDREMARLFECLDRNALTDETLVVFFSDHGEEQREHGGTFHNTNVYEELARVPLVVRGPGVAAGTSAEDVSLVDLWQTLARTIGRGDPASRSIDLWPLLRGEPDRDRVVAVELDSDAGQRHRALVAGGWKVIENLTSRTRELYDLTNDPLERSPLAHERAEDAPEVIRRFLSGER